MAEADIDVSMNLSCTLLRTLSPCVVLPKSQTFNIGREPLKFLMCVEGYKPLPTTPGKTAATW